MELNRKGTPGNELDNLDLHHSRNGCRGDLLPGIGQSVPASDVEGHGKASACQEAGSALPAPILPKHEKFLAVGGDRIRLFWIWIDTVFEVTR